MPVRFSSRKHEPSYTEQVASAIFHVSPDAMFAIDGDVIAECNGAVEKMLGYSRQQLIGMRPELLSPERQPDGRPSSEIGPHVAQLAFERGSHRFEFHHKRADGSIFKAQVTLIATRIDGRAVLIAVLQDMTSVSQVVDGLSAGLKALAEGDLTRTLDSAFRREYEPLRTNYNAAIAGLRDLIGTVHTSAEALRTGSGEIAQASEDLARRTESNAASLEQTSAAMVQIDNRLKAIAEAADRTVARADRANATVDCGRSTAGEAVSAMERVAVSAKGIDDVIEGLDKIAFQTRVLAMNAAVEAGRAGEAGRGFAVVADLVSALAMRAEEEAKRARDQLTATQHDVSGAVDAVRRVDGALVDISGEVGEVHMLLSAMAADNQAQSSAITQISAAIGSMDRSTQQNAAMVEQTSAAARNLSSEVHVLAEHADRFVTTRDKRRAAASANGYAASLH